MADIQNLKDSPHYKEQTLQLIEHCFEYSSRNSFEIDFYPLFNEHNFANCHILVENEKVIGHIGCLQRSIQLKNTYTLNMFGGIAIHPDFQGKGFFKKIFEHVLGLYPDVAMSFLWSDKLQMYEKFNFYPCVGLVQYHHQNQNGDSSLILEKTLLKNLDDSSLAEIKHLYATSDEIRPLRTDQDWQQLAQITSSDLFLVRDNGKIINYFVQNKGQDLINIVHEYGRMNERDLKLMINQGDVWTPFLSDQSHPVQQLHGSVARIGDEFIFEDFLKELSNVRLVELKEKEITVSIDDEEFSLAIKDFLPGLLGPNTFNEIKAKTLFISGLDSI